MTAIIAQEIFAIMKATITVATVITAAITTSTTL
jgi:hypothetical protein